MFLGANQDSYATGGSVGFQAGNVSNFEAEPDGRRRGLRRAQPDGRASGAASRARPAGAIATTSGAVARRPRSADRRSAAPVDGAASADRSIRATVRLTVGLLVPDDFPMSTLVNDAERAVVEALRDQLSDDWLVLPDVGLAATTATTRSTS